jgi:hypothetical protein
VTDTLVGTAVHATGHIDFNITDIMQIIHVIQGFIDFFGDADGAGVCQ